MKKFNLRELQLKELDILLEVDRLCTKHKIKYSLAYGTAIGAVRHKGFIPWDDDIDIHMKMEDYLKFKKVCEKELNEPYFYQDKFTDSNVNYTWAKIRDSSTCSMIASMDDYPINWGVCIDIFPLMNLKGKSFTTIEKFWIKVAALTANKELNDYGYGSYGIKSNKLKYMPVSICHFLYKIADYYITHKKANEYVFDASNEISEKMVFKSALYDSFMKVDFENNELPIIKNYDDFLTQYYGDYMKIPKEHEQANHGDIIVDLENSYQKYLKMRKIS